MLDPAHLDLLERFIDLPTAPFAEDNGLRFIRDFAAARRPLSLKQDRYGNLLVRYRAGRIARGKRPIVFAGHLDHPGFLAESMSDDVLRASWRGWVRPEYFRGASVRFWSDGAWAPGTIQDIVPVESAEKAAGVSARSFGAESPPEAVLVRVARPVTPGSPGMWDFPDAQIENGRLRARACDDVVGVAAILCMLDELCRKRVAGECYVFFTRAEEVGFAGALAAVADRGLPRKAIIVAIECSKAIAGVSLGAGPILRVGDKATVFTPAATAFCQTVAEDLAKEDSEFRFQRKLMDGGTCESTVYCHFGYDATGLCLPLLNYHNMDLERLRIAPEEIDMADFENLVKWFIAIVRTKRKYDGTHPGLDERLQSLLKRHRRTLIDTRPGVA